MGLLSRVKSPSTSTAASASSNSAPASMPPSQSLPISPVLSEHSKQLYANSLDQSSFSQYPTGPANRNQPAQRTGFVNTLPSPPGSPQIRGQPYQATPAAIYASQQSTKLGPAFAQTTTLGSNGVGGQRTDRAMMSPSGGRGTDVRSQSSAISSNASDVLYNELFPSEGSSTGDVSSDYHGSDYHGNGNGSGVEGRLKNLSIDKRGGQEHGAGNRIMEKTESLQSVEMMDDLPSIDGDVDLAIHQATHLVTHYPNQLVPQMAPRPVATPSPVPSSSSTARATGLVGVPTKSPPSSSASDSTPLQPTTSARKPASRYNLTDFTFIRTLGTGSFGRVHFVRSHHNSRSYAVKVLSKDRVVKMKQVEHTNSEREMLELVRHPFLVNLWGTFKDSKNLYMVMDFVAGGELFSLLRKSQRFPDPVAKFFAAEVALGLDYLHSLDIIYRDLKPENILLGADGHVKITDFGFAKRVPDITWTLCGTPDYLAPEIVQSRGYNKSVDWYALGVLMFEMLAGYPPFFTEDSNPMRLYEKIIAGKVRYPGYFSVDAKDLLKSLLTPDLTKRFGNLANGSRDIFGHIWFAEVDWQRLYKKQIPAPYTPKVDGDWDASNFDQYAETEEAYGATGPDPHGKLFPDF